jgi:CubicO group peptidase (beta-lactamase class C family)
MASTSDEGQCAEHIDASLRLAVDAREVPGVVAALSDAEFTFYTAAFGTLQRSNGIGIEAASIFRIASMTKLVTSVAVMMLVEERQVALDAPIAEYLSDYRQPEVLVDFDAVTGSYTTRQAAGPVTVRQLLTHTSGYGYWFLDARLRQVTSMPPDLFNPPFLIDDPGASFNYSTSIDVLGQIIEPVAGLSLPQFFRRRIFDPLGMRDTSFEKPQDPHRLASIFVRSNGGFVELPTEATAPPPRGGGGLYSTAEDYCRFLRMFLNHGASGGRQLLSSATCDEMTLNQVGGLAVPRQCSAFRERTNDFIFMSGAQQFGFGVAIETEPLASGRPAGSYGWGGIYNTYFWVDPVTEFAAVVLMQMQPFADPMCVAVSRRFERAVYDCL